MAEENKYQAQANELSQKLWAIANELRGQMDASEFKNYILGVIFYRYLSERTELYMQELLENDGITYEEAFADEDFRPVVEEWSLDHLGYIIQPENLFRELIRKIVKFRDDADKFSVEDFERAIHELEGSTMGHLSNKAFDGLFSDMRLQDSRLGETVADRTDMIGRVMVRVSEIDFNLQDSQFDVLGTAYMILIGLFASDAGKKGGEFFTPTGPSKLCATLAALGLDEAKTVGDCTCGSASMLLEVQKHLTTGKVGHFYGQEQNATTYNLARMNMIMHGVDWQRFDIYKGDTLKDDKYGDVKMTGSGSVSVQGDSYRMSGDGLEIWCDGRSVCTVDDSAKEVVIEPLWAGSGAFVNPAAAIRDIDTGFSWDDSGSRTVFNGQDVLVYELSPNGPAADISGMKLYFSPDGHTLTGAEVQTVKVTVTFVISSLEFLKPGDGTEFAIPMFGPDYFVTDLR